MLQIIFHLVFTLNSVRWNIGFSRSLILKLQNKMGFFHNVLQDNSQKCLLTIIESQKLPNLQTLDVYSQIFHFEKTLQNGRRKIHIGYRSATEKCKNYRI